MSLRELSKVLRVNLQVSGQPAQFKAIGTSGQNVTRNFCSNCGSPIFTTIDVDPSQVFVKAGLFPPGQVPKPTIHLFVKNMEDWEVAEEDTTKLETQ
nr:uncharacterized protein CI109_002394 [Kwoniella shandongensis]KAA5529053.1 hypothetical protein CI109_002394 [Kwoniella shandongensis]